MNELIAPGETGLVRAFDVLAAVPVESVWLPTSRSNTRASYRRSVGHFIATLGIDSPEDLYRVSQGHVIAYRERLASAGASRATIANRLSALSSLYRFLADKQLCATNPVSGVKRPKTGNAGLGSGKTPALTPQQVRAMLDAPDTETLIGIRDRAILHVYFYTGGRCSEPGALRVRDFRQDGEYWVLELTVKGGKTNTVAIHTECQIALRRYLEVSGHSEDRDGVLFRAVKAGRNTGAPLLRQRFYQIFKRYALAVGLDASITPHSARATLSPKPMKPDCKARIFSAPWGTLPSPRPRGTTERQSGIGNRPALR